MDKRRMKLHHGAFRIVSSKVFVFAAIAVLMTAIGLTFTWVRAPKHLEIINVNGTLWKMEHNRLVEYVINADRMQDKSHAPHVHIPVDDAIENEYRIGSKKDHSNFLIFFSGHQVRLDVPFRAFFSESFFRGPLIWLICLVRSQKCTFLDLNL